MQDIISTLKNALQQAEAGLEVAVGRLAKDGTERGDFKPSEVLALACVREALAMPVSCLHQIQEPAAAEQAAWHAGLDEGRAQAAQPSSVSNAETPQAAPAAVAVPMAEAWELSAADTEQGTTGAGQDYNQGVAEGLRICAKDLRDALAATPAAVPVVLPEPAPTPCRSMFATQREYADAMEQHRKNLAEVEAERALLATATGLPAQAVGQLPVLYVSKEQLDHHRDPDGPDSANAGRYLPARKTPAGKLTTPLFAAPQAQADARDADGEAFRTAARLGLTLRFYGNCAQSGAPGTPSVYEVTTGPDSAEAMRASIDRAAIAAAKGESQ